MILKDPAVKVEWLLIICTFNAVSGTHFLCSHLQIYTSASSSVRNLCQFFLNRPQGSRKSMKQNLRDFQNFQGRESPVLRGCYNVLESSLCHPCQIFQMRNGKRAIFLHPLLPTFVFIFKTFLPLMHAGRLKTNQKNNISVSTLLIEQTAWDLFCLSDYVLMQL